MIKIRCPKCKKYNVETLVELWRGHTIEFCVSEHGDVDQNEHVQKEGDPYAVEAHCRCGHVWKLKGVSQITEIRGINPDECPTTGEVDCGFCTGEICNKCGAGTSTSIHNCEHDVIDRHYGLKRR